MNKLRRILCLAILLLLLMAQVAAAAEKKHTIWKVRSDKSTVYLVGSIHLLSEKNYPLPEIYDEIYNESQNIAFETDIEQLATPEFQERLMQHGMFPPGQNLQSALTAETFRQLERYLSHSGVDIEQSSQLKPWLCSATITVLELQKFGFSQNFGVDGYFYAKALADGKIQLEMESIDEHLAVLASFDKFDPDIVIMQTLIDLEKLSNYFSDMVRAWENGDSKKLDQLINSGIHDYPEMKEQFLYKRNRNWLPKIEQLLRMRQTGMILVGAAHLTGENSVVDLLRKK